VPLGEISTPFLALAEMRFSPPIVLLLASRYTPSRAFPRRAVPLTSVPMLFPATTLLVAQPYRPTPFPPLGEMRLLAPGSCRNAPTVFCHASEMRTPSTPLPRPTVPVQSVPM